MATAALVKSLALDADGDLDVVANNVYWIFGPDQVIQRLRCRLRTWLGEWFLDESIGVPYRQLIFVKGAPLDQVAAFLKLEIIGTPGIAELISYEQELDPVTRLLTVSFRARYFDGSVLDSSEVL